MSFNLYRQRVKADIPNSEYSNNEIMKTIKDEFYSMPNYYEVYKNGDTSDLYDVVINEGDKDDKVLGYKKLISYPYPTPQFSSGDLIYWNNEIWLLTTLDKQYLYGVKGRIIQCNKTLTFTKNSTSYSVPCVVGSIGQNLGLNTETSRYISDIDDEILVRCQSNSTTGLIAINNVFTIGRSNWKVINISDVLEENTLILKMKWVADAPVTTEQGGWW